MTQRRSVRALAGAALMACCGPCLAGPQYAADDVIQAFSRRGIDQGSRRGVCVGTGSECKLSNHFPPAGAAAPTFDRLINLEYSSRELTEAAKQNLEQLAMARQNPVLIQTRFVLEGHTDGQGSQEYDLDLSQRRAVAVLRFLAGKEVSKAQLAARGYGKSKPRAADVLHASNRRVEARLAD